MSPLRVTFGFGFSAVHLAAPMNEKDRPDYYRADLFSKSSNRVKPNSGEFPSPGQQQAQGTRTKQSQRGWFRR